METFGCKVRTLREKAHMPLRKLAALLELDQSTLSKIERNERRPNSDFINRLSEIFGVEKEDLILSFLSDKVASELLNEKNSLDILKAAEMKIDYLKSNKRITNV